MGGSMLSFRWKSAAAAGRGTGPLDSPERFSHAFREDRYCTTRPVFPRSEISAAVGARVLHVHFLCPLLMPTYARALYTS